VQHGKVGEMIVWSVKGRSINARVQAHRGSIQSLAVTPNGKLLATSGGIGDVSIAIWSVDKLLADHK
jgi:WD40 repeat protein